MAGGQGVDYLLGALYRSLTEPAYLHEFLEQVCKQTRSHIGAVQTHDLAAGQGTVPTAVGMSAESALHYNERYAAHNILIARSGHVLKSGAVIVGDDYVSMVELHDSVYWREYLKHFEVDHVVGVCGHRDADNIALLSVLRSHRRGEYTEAERAWMRRLSPHWVNACKIRSQLGILHDTITCLEAALDRVVLAVLFIDGRGCVGRINRGAERLIAHGDIICVRNGKLIARNAIDIRRLQHALAAAIEAPSDTDHAPRPTSRLVLHGASGIPTAFASIHPLRTHANGALPVRAPQAAVFIRNLFADSPEMLTQALTELFYLTPAEARLACALYTDNDLAQAATDLQLSMNTVRSRLKIIYDKTGIHSQPALVKTIRELRSVLSDTSS